ncbi:MAG: fumarate hydratase [Spirochaetaceae bacterium 4572_59]|nr:MAG: fumarate hydratase [Spirochaetaceae bacterium 4572_59]
MREIQLPLEKSLVKELTVGEELRLNGTIYVGRDQAHQRLTRLIENSEALPFELKGNIIYYMGPSPTPEGRVIGSAGPTTAGRMDPFTPALLDRGLTAMIGKGNRNQSVYDAIIRNGAVFLYAFGGCGALYSDKITSSEVLAFDDLGPEAIYKLKVKDFPVLVAIDCRGNNIFK